MKHFFNIITEWGRKILEFIEEFPSVFFIFLIILGAFLKFNFISRSSFWLDETYSLFIAQQDVRSIIENFSRDQNPPLYFLLLHFWLKFGGYSEAGVRSMSAVFSVVSAPLVFYIGRRYINSFTGVAASLLFTLSPIQLLYAHEARAFALVGLLCLLSFIVFMQMRTSREKVWILLLGVINAALIYSHFIAVFIILSQFVFILIQRDADKTVLKQFALSGVITFVLFLPWLRFVVLNMPESGVYWLQKPGFEHLKGLFISFAGNKILTIIFAAIMVAGAITIIKMKPDDENKAKYSGTFLLLACWTFIPVVADFLVSYITPVFLNRYLLYVSVGMILLVAYSISILKVHDLYKYSLVVVMLIITSWSLNLAPNKRENWREAVKIVEDNKQEGDLVLVSAWYSNHAFAYYYETSFFKDYKNLEDSLRLENIVCVNTMDEDFFQSLHPDKRVITVQSHSKDVDPDNTVIQIVSNSYYPVKAFVLEGIEINIFQKKDLMRVRKNMGELRR